MKKNTINCWIPLVLAVGLGPGSVAASTNGFVVPEFRGAAGSEAGYWESFTVPVGAPGNAPDRPGATTGATLWQSDPAAFITGSGNLYNLTGVSQFTVQDATAAALGTVVLQIRTLGSELDYGSVALHYADGSGTHSLSPLFRLELDRGTVLGASVSSLWQWDLRGLDVDDYSIGFQAAAPSLSLDAMTLDTWTSFVPVPEPSAPLLAGAGMALCLGVGWMRRMRGSR
ncbi:MAG TPA: hypothetical protein VNO52_05055 [Methylomirabilota bacterium]|nr:hypothetical protein [Methylomirabilota bacterium]